MSTQQQINAWNAAILQKQEELAAQERTLGAQQIQLAREEQFLNDIARTSLDLTRPDLARLAAEEIPLARQRVATAKTAIAQTQSNVSSLNESINFNTDQRDQFQSSLPAQGVQASTADDVAVNALANAAEIAPAPVPAANAPGSVANIGAGLGLLDPQQQAEIITPAPAPVAGAPGLLDPQQQAAARIAAPALVSPAADPYSGLTPEQIEFLGDADPTDPFIRARGGLPPLIQPVNVTEPTPVAGAPGLLDPQQQAEIITPAPAPVAGAPGLLDPQQQAEIITPAPAPVAGAPGLLDPQQQAAARIAAPEPVQDFVTDPDTGELVPSDSVQAEQIRAEQNRVQTDAPAPVPRSAIEEGGDAEAQAALTIQSTTAESVPLTDAESAALFEEAEANTIQSTTAESVPLTDAESAALFEEAEANTIQNTTAEPADDPYEAARLAAEEVEPPPTFEAEDLEDSPYEVARLAGEEEGDGPTLEAPEPVNDFVIDPVTGEQVPSDSDRAAEIRAEAAADEQVQVTAPAPVADSTQAEGNAGEAEASAPPAGAPGTLDPQQQAANEQAAAKANTINQATLNSVYKKEGSADWRVRLQLAPSSNYLYNQPEGQRGILDSLYYTNGVIFPYTPQINTSYKANYEQYDLVHSNYRGVYYKNSRVDDLQIRGVFTAQDTNEANYLLAVIHFFRSVTKMFYGKDDQRGTPPPLVYLSGFGMDQFYGHPCVVTSFAYNLPDNVDYIRATSVNNYGTDLLSRRTASSPSSAAGLGATGNRLLNAGLANFTATPPAPSSVVASINNTQLANYVPTKMDIDITLIPVQTRSQVSKQFSLKGFANGNLIKGGFW